MKDPFMRVFQVWKPLTAAQPCILQHLIRNKSILIALFFFLKKAFCKGGSIPTGPSIRTMHLCTQPYPIDSPPGCPQSVI